MGLFRRLRTLAQPENTSVEDSALVTRLRNANDWESLLNESRNEIVLVFKHSTVCSISSQALEEFLQFARQHQSTRVGVVHVVEDRGLSTLIAQDTRIRPESPQLIAIKNERPIWHGSHWGIDLGELEQLVSQRAELDVRS